MSQTPMFGMFPRTDPRVRTGWYPSYPLSGRGGRGRTFSYDSADPHGNDLQYALAQEQANMPQGPQVGTTRGDGWVSTMRPDGVRETSYVPSNAQKARSAAYKQYALDFNQREAYRKNEYRKKISGMPIHDPNKYGGVTTQTTIPGGFYGKPGVTANTATGGYGAGAYDPQHMADVQNVARGLQQNASGMGYVASKMGLPILSFAPAQVALNTAAAGFPQNEQQYRQQQAQATRSMTSTWPTPPQQQGVVGMNTTVVPGLPMVPNIQTYQPGPDYWLSPAQRPDVAKHMADVMAQYDAAQAGVLPQEQPAAPQQQPPYYTTPGGVVTAPGYKYQANPVQPQQPQLQSFPGGNVVFQNGQPIYMPPAPTTRPATPITVAPGAAVYDPNTGQPVYVNPAPPPQQQQKKKVGKGPPPDTVIEEAAALFPNDPAAAKKWILDQGYSDDSTEE